MSTSREWLEKYTKDELIRTVQGLEDTLAEAARGLMTEGSRQELAYWKRRSAILSDILDRNAEANARLPRIIRWWYGC